MKNFLMKVWKVVDAAWGTLLTWCGNKYFTFFLALVIAFAAYFGADPNEGIPDFNVYLIAWLAGTLVPAVLLTGTSIVKKESYNLVVAAWGALGALLGVVLAVLIEKIAC